MTVDGMGGALRVERQGLVELWTLNRPERRNALSVPLLQTLLSNAIRVYDDSTCRVVVITGDMKAFSAGADLKEREGKDGAFTLGAIDLFRAAFDAIDRLPLPVIAAMDGLALGGGLELALACDLRIAAPGIRLGLPETTLGIIPGAGGTQRLTRLVGPARAKEWILLGEIHDVEEALRVGVVTRLAAAGQTALATAIEIAERLAEGATVALGAALEAIDAAVDSSTLEEGLDRERVCYERTLATADRVEALVAFREKRKPRFLGK